MSFASQQPTVDSRALHRALRIVASVIALLTVILIMRTAPGPVAGEAGDPLRGEPGRQRHPEVFALLINDPVDDTLPDDAALASASQPLAESGRQRHPEVFALLSNDPADDTLLADAALASASQPRAEPAEPPAAAPSALPAETLAAAAVAETFTGLAAIAPAVSSRAAARGTVVPASPPPAAPPQVAAEAPAIEQSLPSTTAESTVRGEIDVEQRITELPLTVVEAWQAYEEFATKGPAAPPTYAGTGLDMPAAPPSLEVAEGWQAYEEFAPSGPPARVAEPPADAVEIAAIEASGKPAARFERLGARGEPVADDEPWNCVRDNRTGLVWEVKTRGGLRDAAHVYSWYDPLQQEASGARDGGRCEGGIDCDTRDYQDAVNHLALCGFDDWRLPARDELQTLVEAAVGRGAATIDDKYFPAALASWYWSASANDRRPDYAWYVLFRNGLPLNDLKSRPKHIRLVRGQHLLLASQ